MSYKIAIASSDEISVDETFGAARVFHIYEVTDEGYSKVEDRTASEKDESGGCESTSSCGSGGGCHNGQGGGCAGGGEVTKKVELVADCRCVVCKKIGFNIQKQFERRAITSFDVSCSIEEALSKISSY